jgi:3-hydroxybutyrate dehydrogenase
MSRSAAFAGKVVVVTGAGTGIGRAIAHEFAIAGAKVVMAGRRLAKLEETQSAAARDGGEAVVHATDINDEESVRALISNAAAITGRIDVLVNNAGVSAVEDPMTASSDQDWSATIDTNLTAAYRLVRVALPHVPDGGRIINVASVLGLRAAPKSAAYVASKHGLVGLTKALALDLAERGITVNAICPGWVDTDMARDIIGEIAKSQGVSPEETRASILKGIPMHRMVQPDEVAAVSLFLAGPGGAAITGQAITICAGSSLV